MAQGDILGILKNRASNLVINGGLEYWQRGTSFTAAVNATFSADRFKYGKLGTMVHNVSRSTNVPTLAQAKTPITYSLLQTVTTAQPSLGAGDYVRMEHILEGNVLKNIAGKTFTISFWVRAFKTGIYSVSFQNWDQSRSYLKEYTILAADTWERKTLTLQHDPSGSWFYDTAIGMKILFTQAAGTTFRSSTVDTWLNGSFMASTNQVNGVDNVANDFIITGVMLNEGYPVPFEFAGGNTITDFSLCQRYFVNMGDVKLTGATAPNLEIRHSSMSFPVEMRIIPAFSFRDELGASSVFSLRSTNLNASHGHSFGGFASNTKNFSYGNNGNTTGGTVSTFSFNNLAADAEL